MSKEVRPHKITERCLAYSPRARKPWQCKHCGQLFHTKNSALDHQCALMGEKRIDSDSEARPLQPEASTAPIGG